ncbi:MASE1 domain-containing protein [Cupriavidus sp. IK-TO18]|uniref:MASE1 domain-containing protein n=1 Tax=Cupriavidus sp. IK-TO18 TaxID=2782182 RepID=UPI00189878D5|nr:MASE1 domain-containing protein [Cupriavidus sp. IK-TO18]MBF6987621.1 MASE1 domain-containing protein [Cupriavidus sp. IK-TO18]
MQQIRLAAIVAVLVLVAGVVSRSLAHASTEAVPVWLGSGVTFAALLVCARWSWPAVLAGAGLALAGWGMATHGLPLRGAVAFGLIEVISLGTAGWIATYGRRDPQSPPGATLLIAGALVGSALGASLAVELWRWQRPGLDLPVEWRAWAFSTAAGLLLVGPLAVAFRGFRVRRSGGMPMQQFAAGGLAFVVFIVAVLAVFSDNAAQRFGGLAPTLAYVPMPLLLATALLWGQRGGAIATLLGCLLIIHRTAAGAGPFNVIEGFPGEAVVEVQGFVIVWALVMLLGRALSEGRRTALEEARAWRLRYARTLQAVGVASVEYDAVTGRATWSEGAAALLGDTIRDVNSVDEWLDHIDATDRGLVQATWSAVARGDAPDSVQEYAVTLPGSGRLHVHERLAGIRGADGKVEQVAALLRRAGAEPAHV